MGQEYLRRPAVPGGCVPGAMVREKAGGKQSMVPITPGEEPHTTVRNAILRLPIRTGLRCAGCVMVKVMWSNLISLSA